LKATISFELVVPQLSPPQFLTSRHQVEKPRGKQPKAMGLPGCFGLERAAPESVPARTNSGATQNIAQIAKRSI
jgi:hypothetical protein